MPGDSTARLDGALHSALMRSFLERGHAGSPQDHARTLECGPEEVHAAMARLEEAHSLVRHAGSHDVWLAHPFSAVPTGTWVSGAERGWWAPCIWCAFGIATLVKGPVRIVTRLCGEDEACAIDWDRGVVDAGDRVAHFPVCVARAWDDVHRFCSSTQVFAQAADVPAWCGRHAIAPGAVLGLDTVARLARAWYGGYLASDWRKHTAAEARAIFQSVGLVDTHWHVPGEGERF